MARRVAIIDFETRAARDLKKTGVEAYVECPHFRASCLAWCFDQGDGVDWEVHGWDILQAPDDPRMWFDGLGAHVRDGGAVVAHNARFELLVWRKLRERDPDTWPELRAEQMIDTMALARAMALPAALAQTVQALGLPIEKDMDGHKLMLKLCKPRAQRRKADKGKIEWNEDPADLARQLEYCKRDVEAERAVFRMLPELSADEQATWVADQDINDFGIYVDREAIQLCLDAVTEEQERLNSELCLLTDGYVKTANSAQALKAWCAAWDVILPDCRKDTVQAVLAGRIDGDPVQLPSGEWTTNVRRVIEIRQEAAKASTAKLKAMMNGLCADGRVHGLLEYHGAATGRWAGRRVQPQNMIRTPETFGPEQAEDVFAWLKAGAGNAQ